MVELENAAACNLSPDPAITANARSSSAGAENDSGQLLEQNSYGDGDNNGGSSDDDFAQPLCCVSRYGRHSSFGLKWNVRNLQGFFTRQMLATAIYGLLCLYWNCVIQIVVQTKSEVFTTIPKKYNMTASDAEKINTLPDLGFDWLPYLSNHKIADYFVVALLFTTHTRFLPTPQVGLFASIVDFEK